MESNTQHQPVEDADFKPEQPDSTPKPVKRLQLPVISKAKQLFSTVASGASGLKNTLSRLKLWTQAKFGELHFSQCCYFVATIMLIIYLSKTNPAANWHLWVGVVAGFGLVRELWQIFARIWEHTFGKGILLVIYAATANFALATSALQINNVSGIEPQAFVFTMGFTTLIMLPFWLLAASILFLGSAILIGNLWLLISVLLRIIGIKVKLHWEDKSFALLTMLMRLLLIPFLIAVVVSMISPYLKQISVNELQHELNFYSSNPNQVWQPQVLKEMSDSEILSTLVLIKDKALAELSEQEMQQMEKLGLTSFNWLLLHTASEQELPDIVAQLKQKAEQAMEQTDESSPQGEVITNNQATAEAPPNIIAQMIAWFIYRFETYPYSSCIKQKTKECYLLSKTLCLLPSEIKMLHLAINSLSRFVKQLTITANAAKRLFYALSLP